MTKQEFFEYCFTAYGTSPDYPFEGDFETAVKYGSNIVRIGSLLYGYRKY